jgi:hypothetical protein
LRVTSARLKKEFSARRRRKRLRYLICTGYRF